MSWFLDCARAQRLYGAFVVGAACGGDVARAYAHGPAPAVIGVVASDAQGPHILALTEGFALREGNTLRFVCPARFGMDKLPLAASTEALTTWVAGKSAAALWTGTDITVTSENRITSNTLIAFAHGTGRLFALTYGVHGSDILALSDTSADLLFHDDAPWLSISFDGADLWLARVHDFVVQVRRSTTSGSASSTRDIGFASAPRRVELRSAGSRVFLHATFDNRSELRELTADPGVALAVDDSAMFGPVVGDDGALLLGFARGLVRLAQAADPDALVRFDSALHCLETRANTAYVCTQTAVFRASAALSAGAREAPLLTLSMLYPPAMPVREDAAEDATCAAQWLTFRADLARASIPLPDPATPMTADAGTDDAGRIVNIDQGDASSADADNTADSAIGMAEAGAPGMPRDFSNSSSASACALTRGRSQRSPYLWSALWGALLARRACRRRERTRARTS